MTDAIKLARSTEPLWMFPSWLSSRLTTATMACLSQFSLHIHVDVFNVDNPVQATQQMMLCCGVFWGFCSCSGVKHAFLECKNWVHDLFEEGHPYAEAKSSGIQNKFDKTNNLSAMIFKNHIGMCVPVKSKLVALLPIILVNCPLARSASIAVL